MKVLNRIFIRKKSAIIFALSSNLLLSCNVFAQIDPKALWNVSSLFKKDKEYMSPIFGHVAQKVISNIRLYGYLRSGKDLENDTRIHSQDTPLDSHTWIVNILFPSSTGQLNHERATEDNFGRLVKNPQTVALILKYVEIITEKIKNPSQALGKKALASLLLTESSDKQHSPEFLSQAWRSKENSDADSLNSQIKKLMKEKKEIEHIINNFEKEKAKEENSSESQKNTKSSLQEIKEKIEDLRQKIEKRQDKTIVGLEEKIQQSLNGSKSELKSLLRHIEKAVILEHNIDSPYPRHLTTHILLGFFCSKFNSQKDVWDLLNALGEEYVDLKQVPQEERYMIIEDVKEIEKKHGMYEYPVKKIFELSLDETFSLYMGGLFSTPHPYSTNHLIINGSAYVDIQPDQLLGGIKFPDCSETTFRHIFNLLLFSGGEFSLDHLKGKIPSSSFDLLTSYYDVQKVRLANSGDPLIRSLWNQVAGNMNKRYDLEIQNSITYIDQIKGVEYELDAGFFNAVFWFQGLLGLSKEAISPDSSFKEKKKWVKKEFQKIFTLLNPHYAYSFKFQKDIEQTENQTSPRKELSGTLRVNVKKFEGNEVFKFDIYSKQGKHSEIQNLTSPLTADFKKRKDLLSKVTISGLLENTFCESMWLLTGHEERLHPSLLYLFSKPLDSNESRLEALEKIFPTPGKMKSKKIDLPQEMKVQIFRNIIDEIHWNNKDIVQKISYCIETWKNSEDLKDVLACCVKGLDAGYGKRISLNSLPKLKHLWLNQNISRVEGLENCSHLKTLEIRESKTTDLPFKNFNNLEKFHLQSSEINNLYEVNQYCKKLKEANLSRSKGFTSVNFSACENLQILDCSFSSISELDIRGCSFLKTLSIQGTAIQSLTLSGLEKNLTNLICANTRISIFDLKGFNQLEEIDLSNTEIQEIDLTGCHNLRDLILNNTKITKIDISGMENTLRNLSCKNTNISEIYLEGFHQLKILDLSETKITQLTLPDRGNLEIFDASGSSIAHLTVNGPISSDFKICLKGTKITRENWCTSIRGSEFLTDENFIW